MEKRVKSANHCYTSKWDNHPVLESIEGLVVCGGDRVGRPRQEIPLLQKVRTQVVRRARKDTTRTRLMYKLAGISENMVLSPPRSWSTNNIMPS